MGFNIENAAKQIAALGPTSQAKLFESLARLTGHSGLKELAENYQRLLDQADSALALDAGATETKAPSKPKPYLLADEMDSLQPNRIGESAVVYGSPNEKIPEAGKNYEELYAIFDGEMLRPETKIDLEINTRCKVFVERPMAKFPEIKNRALRRIAARAIPMGIHDFAEQHDHYLYGVPKK